jgi:hypothetical protein
MIDTSLKVTKSEGGSFTPIPEGTYQVQVVDVKQKQSQTQYGLKDKFVFSCAVVDDEEYMGRLVFVACNISWFNGEGGKRPSKLFTFIKTIYAHYQKDVKVSEVTEVTGEMVNELVGKQFIAVVKVDDKFNNVTDFMKVKKEIAYEHKKSEQKMNENIDPEDIKI